MDHSYKVHTNMKPFNPGKGLQNPLQCFSFVHIHRECEGTVPCCILEWERHLIRIVLLLPSFPTIVYMKSCGEVKNWRKERQKIVKASIVLKSDPIAKSVPLL